MTTPAIRAALDAAEQHATAEIWVGHPLAIILAALIKQTRAALAAEPAGDGPPVVMTSALLHPAYEPGDGSADGAQLVELAWWHPVMGCDSLQIVVDNARNILRSRWACPATPPPLAPGYIDPEHHGEDRELLETFFRACNAEGGTSDEIHLRGIKAVLAAHPTAPPAPEPGEVGEMPTLTDVDELCVEFSFHPDDGSSLETLHEMFTAALARWGHPAVPVAPAVVPVPQSGPTDGPAVQSREPASVAAEASSLSPAASAAPEPGEVREVVELVEWLRSLEDRSIWFETGSPEDINRARAATLLQQQAAPAPAVVPVAVNERPWEREGWCDADRRCWCYTPREDVDGVLIMHSRWILSRPAEIDTHCLPHHAIPMPQAGEGEA